MEQLKPNIKNIVYGIIAFSVLIGLYISSRYNYLLFHGLVEYFSIVIACGIFMIAWNTKRFLNHGYFLVIGIGSLFVSALDMLHALSYKGMPIFPEYGANLATQFWIAARYLQSFTFLGALFFLNHQPKPIKVFFVFGSVFLVTVLSIFWWDIFPTCYIDGYGLTSFKKISEYVISVIFMGAIALLINRRNRFERHILQWMVSSLLFTILSELSFTFYSDVYGIFNLIGHYFKILAFFCVYKAIIEAGLSKPYELLFRELKRNEERYRSLFSNMIDGFANHEMIYDKNGKPIDFIYLEINQAFLELTGLSAQNVIGKKVTEVFPGIENDSANWINIYGEVASYGKPIRYENYSDTLKKWYSVMVYSIEKGYFVTVFTDITARKTTEEQLIKSHSELEQNVRDRTQELQEYATQLERKNIELEEFAFAASHDLQEPLRKIQVFGSLLKKNTQGNALEENNHYVDRMINSAQRLQGLVKDLLSYSRASLKTGPYDLIDLNEAVNMALENLETKINESNTDIKIGQLMEIEADQMQIVQLFQNLIGNAIKFSQKHPKPNIRIYSRQHGDADKNRLPLCDILIEDNGIGFDQKYLPKLFKPFERLHKAEGYEGTGIGLAICKRIVERHRGDITAESKPGIGATFIVTLPVFQTTKEIPHT